MSGNPEIGRGMIKHGGFIAKRLELSSGGEHSRRKNKEMQRSIFSFRARHHHEEGGRGEAETKLYVAMK